MSRVERALVSVHDKTGVAELARGLHRLGVAIVSTGSTATAVAEAGVPVTEVAELTGFPESLGGRVKTLHPKIHAGILADRSDPRHLAELDELGIGPIDLVVANLYPFHATVASGAPPAEVVEMIDIGGPTLVRAAAKNHAHVGVVVDPGDYGPVLGELERGGELAAATRRDLAARAFAHVAVYDAAIAAWFQRDEPFPPVLTPAYRRVEVLRYGENPHQQGAWYADALTEPWGLSSVVQHHGRELSYTNLLDAEAAWALANAFEAPCVTVVKHTNPTGLALADELATAYERALEGDPVAAFGGIVGVNRALDRATAALIAARVTDIVVAPGYADGAVEVLKGRRQLRVLEVTRPGRPQRELTLRTVQGGALVQDADTGPEPTADWRVVTSAQPDEPALRDLRFAWEVCRHVKSNAIVLARDEQVVGVGAGQMSRVDAVRLAVDKAGERAAGSVLASDAFFPFRDGPDAAAAAGIVAIAQPGGSVRDEEVVAAADEHRIAMVLTGRRHFRH